MRDEAATVHWFPAGVHRPISHEPEAVLGRDRTFDSIDEAVTFVMEKLREPERTNAYIATASRDISIQDIKGMYTARKGWRGTGTSRLDPDQSSLSPKIHAMTMPSHDGRAIT